MESHGILALGSLFVGAAIAELATINSLEKAIKVKDTDTTVANIVTSKNTKVYMVGGVGIALIALALYTHKK